MWVWELVGTGEVTPVLLRRKKCRRCGKSWITDHGYQFESQHVPLEMIRNDAMIYVPKEECRSRSGNSWTSGGGFVVPKGELLIITVPKTMGEDIVPPHSSALEDHWSDHRVICARSLGKAKDVETLDLQEVETVCFNCLDLGKPEKIQGHLSIYKVADVTEDFMVDEDRHGDRGIYWRKVWYGGVESPDNSMFNHVFHVDRLMIRDEVRGALISQHHIEVTSRDHETVWLDPGAYVVFHPRPARGDAD